MTADLRVQLSRVRGWRLPPGAVIVSRNTGFGNPFLIEDAIAHGQAATKDQARAVVIRLHDEWLDGYGPDAITVGRRTFDRRWVLERLPVLRGRMLGCWCALPAEPGLPDICHRNNLVARANPVLVLS